MPRLAVKIGLAENLQNTATFAEVSTLEAELARIDREISLFGIPKGYSDLFFLIKSHLDVVGVRLGLRQAELQSQISKAA